MSYPSSAASSLAPSRSSTPLPPPPPKAQISGSQHQLHTTKLTHKLRHMFDSTPRTALFQATVTIHELTNIPQLEGQYAVSYKFRGKRPKSEAVASAARAATAAAGGKGALGVGGKPQARDRLSVPPLSAGGISPKPSLPNLKLQQPSQSSVSLKSSAASSTQSTHYLPGSPQSQPPSQNRTLLTRVPSQKASSLPAPPAFTPVASSASTKSGIAGGSTTTGARSEKKISDPTPLRRSMGPDEEDDDDTPSPHLIMEEPEEVSEGLGAIDDPTPTGSSGSSRTSFESSSLSTTGRFPTSRGVDSPRPLSAVSSTSHLSVPFPRSSSALPPARSGTLPSAAVLTGPVAGTSDIDFNAPQNQPHAQPLSRSSTLSGDRISLASSPAEMMRHRSHTDRHGAPHIIPPIEALTVPRKGTTPARPLRSHTVSWEYQVQHLFKVPLGKPVALAEAPTPSSGRPRDPLMAKQGGVAPVLGAGPMSESGLKLTIEQLPTVAPPSTPRLGSGDNNEPRSPGAAQDGRPQDRPKTAAEKEKEKERIVFGYVNIDLAPFAGLGPTTRKFLLKDSRTNATVRITVDMKWLGGEEKWAAPPMQEGHHATGIKDLTGNEAQEQVRSDLHLRHTPSRSSSSDMSSISGQPSNRSTSSTNLPRAQSAISLVTHPPQLGYKSYEHHLKETKAEPSLNAGATLPSQMTPSRTRSTGPVSPGGEEDDGFVFNPGSQFLTIPMEKRARSPSPTPSISGSPFSSPGHARRPSHRHHTHHMRGSVHILNDPASLTAEQAQTHELPPEFVIEAIFNPRPAGEFTPFTYVPMRNGSPLFGDYSTNPGAEGGEKGFESGWGNAWGGAGGGGAGAGGRMDLDQIEEHPPSPKEGADPDAQSGARKGWGKLKLRVMSGGNKDKA